MEKVRVHRGGNERLFHFTPVKGGASVDPDEFWITGVTFEIDDTKLAYARQTEKTNTHAYAVGTFQEKGVHAGEELVEFFYVEPASGEFHTRDGKRIIGGQAALFLNAPEPKALMLGPLYHDEEVAREMAADGDGWDAFDDFGDIPGRESGFDD